MTVAASESSLLGNALALECESAKDAVEAREDVGVAHTNYAHAQRTKVVVALPIFRALGVVHAPVDFDREPKLGAVEIDDVTSDHRLASELPCAEAPTSQLPPERSFAACWRLPHRAGVRELLLERPRLDEERCPDTRTSSHDLPIGREPDLLRVSTSRPPILQVHAQT